MKTKTARRFLARNQFRLAVAKWNGVVNHMVWRARQCEKVLRREK